METLGNSLGTKLFYFDDCDYFTSKIYIHDDDDVV